MRCAEWKPIITATDQAWQISPAAPGDLVWVDPLTRTRFRMERQAAVHIAQAALAELRDQPADQIYARLISEALAAAALPADPHEYSGPGQAPPRSARLVDRAMLRTAIFGALFGGSRHPDWPQLRKASLLFGLAEYPDLPTEPPAGLEDPVLFQWLLAADNVALGRPAPELGDARVDLVKGGTVKIKQYFLETNHLKSIRGASWLLDDINLNRIPGLFSDAPFSPEMVVYAGGGHVLAVVPAGEGAGVARHIERLYERVTVTAQCTAAAIILKARDLADAARTCLDDLETALSERQMSRLPVPPDGYGDPDINYRAGRYLTLMYTHESQAERCDLCGIRKPQTVTPLAGEELHLCCSCLYKFTAGTDARARLFHEYCHTAGIQGIAPPQTIDLLADESRYAVYYGDGNNMGKVVTELRSLAEFRLFSQRTENTVVKAVFDALQEHGVEKVEFVALGGDDLFFLGPAGGCLEIATSLGRRFERAFANLTAEEGEPQYTITMSIGVAIAPVHMPVRQAFDVALHDLLKLAKQAARKLTGTRIGGTVEVVALESGQVLDGGVTSRRMQLAGRLQNAAATLRPFTWSEADAFRSFVHDLKTHRFWERSALHNLRHAVTTLGLEEAQLYYLYQLARRMKKNKDSGQAFKQSWQRLRAAYAVQGDGPFLQVQGIHKSPWVDVVELFEYVKEGGTHD